MKSWTHIHKFKIECSTFYWLIELILFFSPSGLNCITSPFSGALSDVLLYSRVCTHREKNNLQQENVTVKVTIISSMFNMWTATLAGLPIISTAIVVTLPKFVTPHGGWTLQNTAMYPLCIFPLADMNSFFHSANLVYRKSNMTWIQHHLHNNTVVI